jgi:hypothetical protein
MAEGLSFKIPVLKRDGNCRQWLSQMKALMVIRNLEYVLENDVNGDDEYELRADAKCKAILQLHVGGALTSVVQRSNSAKQAWDALHEEHLGRAHVRKARLLAQANGLEQGDGTVQQYIDKAKDLRDEFLDSEMIDTISLITTQFVRGLITAAHGWSPGCCQATGR